MDLGHCIIFSDTFLLPVAVGGAESHNPCAGHGTGIGIEHGFEAGCSACAV